MSARERLAVTGSLIVNAILVTLLVLGRPIAKPQPDPAPPDMQFIDMSVSVLQDATDGTGPECDNRYIGVGFIYNRETLEILQTPEHLPAYKAGIRPGDVVEQMPQPPMEVGHTYYFQVWRTNSHRGYLLRPQRICYLTGPHA